MLYWLAEWLGFPGVLNLIRYLSFRSGAAVATAHPAKFPEVVEPLVGHAIALPTALAAMLDRPAHADPLADDGDALRRQLRG